MLDRLYTDEELLYTDEKLDDLMYRLQGDIDHLEGCLHLNSFHFKKTGSDTFRTRLGWMNRIEAKAKIASFKKQLHEFNDQFHNKVPRTVDPELRREKILEGSYVPPERAAIARYFGLKKARKVMKYTNTEYSPYCCPELEEAIEEAEAAEY